MGGWLLSWSRRLCILTVVLAFLALGPVVRGAAEGTGLLGQDAVRFSGTDLLGGQPASLSDSLKNKIILLEFGSIYSSTCMAKLPALLQLRRKYPENQLAIFNIYLDIYNPQRVLKLFRSLELKIGFNVLIDQGLKISRAYKVESLPTTVVIDQDGMVRMVFSGHSGRVAQELDRLLGDLIGDGNPEETGTTIAAATKRGSLVIYSPESFTKTQSNNLDVVGFVSGEGKKELSYKLNNQSEKYAVSQDGIFHFRTNLSLAMNIIEIKAQTAPREFASESLIIFREASFGAEFKSDLPPYLFHQNEDQKPCLRCHRLELTPEERNPSNSTKVCESCHRDLTRQTFLHQPIMAGNCLSCHDYKSAPTRYQLIQNGQNLCRSCHADTAESRTGKVVHGPVAAGACTVCHDPHGSSEKYRLRRKVEELCLTCHPEIMQQNAKKELHVPFAKEPCTACHSPHASDNEWTLRKPLTQMCMSCHVDGDCMHRSHIGEAPSQEVSPTEIQILCGPSGRINCITCHTAHASTYYKLVKGTRTEGVCAVLCHGLQPATNEAP